MVVLMKQMLLIVKQFPVLDTLEGNVTGNVTGNVSGTTQCYRCSRNTYKSWYLTGLTIGGDLTLDSAGAVVYDKSEKSLTFGDKHFATSQMELVVMQT